MPRPIREDLGTHTFDSNSDLPEVTVQCLSIEYRKVIRSNAKIIDKHEKDQDVLHAIVALYNSYLPNIEPDVLYSSICDRNARTIILLLSPEAALEQMCAQYKCEPELDREAPTSSKESTSVPPGGDGETQHLLSEGEQRLSESHFLRQVVKPFTEEEEEAAKKVCPNCRNSKYASVYSDEEDDEAEDSEEGSEDDSDDEEFSAGIDHFIAKVCQRRHERRLYSRSTQRIKQSSISIENRLIAAITIERSRIIPQERINHITVIAVRKKYRKLGLGQFLMEKIKDPKIVDFYDTLAVLADADAIPFFKKQGFTDDVLVCSRYEDLKGTWTDCLLMIHLSPYMDAHALEDDTELKTTKKELRKLQTEGVKTYHKQMRLVEQLKSELLATNKIVKLQKEIIFSLTKELAELDDQEE